MLAFLLNKLDKVVFNNNIAKIKFVIGKRKPKENYVSYQPKGDCYKIVTEMEKKALETVKMYRHFPFETLKESSQLKEWYRFPQFTTEEFLLFLAVHEVRHRVQHRFPIKFVLPDALNAVDPYLKGVLFFEKICFSIEPPKIEYTDKEFDARVISWLAIRLWKERKSISELGFLLKQDAKSLLRKVHFTIST